MLLLRKAFLIFGAVLLLLLPLHLLYYLSAGARHRFAWHLPLLLGLVLALAANAFWLYDWVGFWWIRVPPSLDALSADRRTLTFRFADYGHIDGVDFHAGCSPTLTATELRVGADPLPASRVNLGATMRHPEQVPFTVHRQA